MNELAPLTQRVLDRLARQDLAVESLLGPLSDGVALLVRDEAPHLEPRQRQRVVDAVLRVHLDRPAAEPAADPLRHALFRIRLLASDPDVAHVDRLVRIEHLASAALTGWHPADADPPEASGRA